MRLVGFLLVLALKICLAAILLVFQASAQSLAFDPVLDWNALMIDAIRLDNSGPTLSTRNFAILHTAIYDAVNSIEQTHQSYYITSSPLPGASPEAAAVSAGYTVMLELYPGISARAESLYLTYLSHFPPTLEVTNGLQWGEFVAGTILQWRVGDGAATMVPYIPSDEPGAWRRTPPFFRPPVDPQWRYVEPFGLGEIEPFVPPGPPALPSAEYAAAFNEVKDIGGTGSKTRTPEQSQIATFWSDFSYTAMPPGHWHEIAAIIARARGNSFAENARLFALISIAQADAAIVCWEAKYRFNFWRPVTAIQRADQDGNSATVQDTNWVHFLNAPSFPEYTSGHSTFSKASATVLANYYGTDSISFAIGSDALPGVTRSFSSLAACADEIGQSRIYGGIHFQFSNRDGKACGKKIGDFIWSNYLLPNEGLPMIRFEGRTDDYAQLRVQGHIGTDCVVDASGDLLLWRPISTNRAIAGGVTVLDLQPVSGSSRFYRVRER